ncbi:MAG TPA: glycosyltransferase family 2 protein [Fimbriimonas sp.]|nr:glycosyltransferase family 2 protein [Fimbriimonas sp.]
MLSVVVVNWNTKHLLRACLSSLRKFPASEGMQVIVVDNASSDQSAEMVSEEFPELTLIASSENTGYAKGNNIGFERAEGEFILTLNPDTELMDASLDAALQVMKENPTVGCLGVKQIGTDSKVQRSVRGFPSAIGILGDILKITKGKLGSYRLALFDYESQQPAPQPMGTFLLFRRKALEAVGDAKHPFDEAFPIFFNEVDLLYRLSQAGWGCLYTPKARILHHGGESTRQVRKNMIWESHRSLARYLRKHAATGTARLQAVLLTPVLYAAAFVRAKGYHAGFRP